MAIKDILTLVATLASFFLTVLIPTFIVMINRIKAVKKAKTEAERQAAINDIASLIKGFVEEAEAAYKGVESIIKQQGGSCGSAKKDTVMTKLLRACIDKKLDFDEAYWSEEVDKFVKVTKSVNAK